MNRSILAIVVASGLMMFANADPVKKAPAVDPDKLTKECGEAFIKLLLESKVDDALKLCATPFRDPQGKVHENLDEIKKEFTQAPPPGIEIKIGDTIALDKYNEWAKKNKRKEFDADALKEYGEFLGKDGRIVLLEVKMMGQPLPGDDHPHMLIRIKEGKAQITGFGGR